MKTALRLLFITLALTAIFGNTQAQPVNGYAEVTAISGTTLTLAATDETYDDFADGESIIIMQMQDDVIGANTGDNASFGNLHDIES